MLNRLQESLQNRDRKAASGYALSVKEWAKTHMEKTPFQKVRDFIFALLFALVVAMLMRSMWFEIYEIPTGSMRPTLQESDRLTVSKTAFGLNIPLYKGHLLFQPELVERLGIVIFTARDLDIADIDTMYFYLFPGKKQFVKRLIGKPGDTLYFYGGQIYGIDRDGNDISSELQLPMLSKIEHVPYIHFNGRVNFPFNQERGIYSPVILSQMNQKVARLKINTYNRIEGELLEPYEHKLDDYFDLWGFKTYGMARILTKAEALALADMPSPLVDAPFYLEIFHHPSVKYPTIQRGQGDGLFPGVGVSQTMIPLTTEHLKILHSNLYTARFVVKEGYASRYGSSIKPGKTCKMCVALPDVPDGTYEFYYGKAHAVHTGGITSELPPNHPLQTFTPERLQTLYNLGIEWFPAFSPRSKGQALFPSRYVYYRHGDLYALGTLLMEREDPTLIQFLKRESSRQQNAPSYRPYLPFDDAAPPFTEEGKIDPAFLKRYGISVPSGHYLVLGDNYAMSADSRDFGFVPEANIRGAPAFIFWPPGSRWGFPLQPSYPFLNVPRAIIWSIVAIVIIFWWIWVRKQGKLPIKIEEI